jgi:L-threonylcarbamoyladenylate synthase
MEILPVSPESLSQAAEVLRNGGIVVFPTETVYGLGADAYNSAAIVKVFEAKGRPHFDPLIVHIADIKTLEKVADFSLLKEKERNKLFILIEKFWPGPLSFVLPKSEKIPGIVTAGLSTVAIRFPAHEAAQKLISISSRAVAAPSANPFGTLSPPKAEHVQETLSDKVDIILDGG